MKKYKIAVVGSDPGFKKRADIIGSLFHCEVMLFDTVDQFAEAGEQVSLMDFAIISAVQAQSQSEMAGLVQTVRFIAQKCPIAIIVEKKIKSEDAVFIKKSGANVVLLEDEFLLSSKIEFFVARYLFGEWVVIKSYELIAAIPLPFSLYHLMPLNERMLAIVQQGQALTKEKLEKFNTVGEFYIHRNQLENYVQFLSQYNDQSAAGLKRRCRAVFLNFVKSYKDLILLLTDQSEASSYQEGSALFQKLTKFAGEVISQLGATGEAWDVINNSSLEDFTPLDRCSAVAAYSGLLSLMSGVGKPEDVMMAALISDLGLLDLSPKIIEKIRKQNFTSFSEDEKKEYELHPQKSLNKVLSRKLPLPEEFKNIIMMSHENFSMTGFPNKVSAQKIPEESYLIQFCELLDGKGLVEFGKPRKSPVEVRKEVLDQELSINPLRFPPDFLQKMRVAF